MAVVRVVGGRDERRSRGVQSAEQRRGGRTGGSGAPMTYEDIHREEARSTDAGASVQDLIAIGPPCKDCGIEVAVQDSLCLQCHPEFGNYENEA